MSLYAAEIDSSFCFNFAFCLTFWKFSIHSASHSPLSYHWCLEIIKCFGHEYLSLLISCLYHANLSFFSHFQNAGVILFCCHSYSFSFYFLPRCTICLFYLARFVPLRPVKLRLFHKSIVWFVHPESKGLNSKAQSTFLKHCFQKNWYKCLTNGSKWSSISWLQLVSTISHYFYCEL